MHRRPERARLDWFNASLPGGDGASIMAQRHEVFVDVTVKSVRFERWVSLGEFAQWCADGIAKAEKNEH